MVMLFSLDSMCDKMKNYSMQELAFIGDAVHTKFVREQIIKNNTLKLNEIHKTSSKFCSAKWQSKIYEKIKDMLDFEESEIMRMARNSKPKHTAKNADPADYHKATAFEALVGWLYLNNKIERLDVILNLSINEE